MGRPAQRRTRTRALAREPRKTMLTRHCITNEATAVGTCDVGQHATPTTHSTWRRTRVREAGTVRRRGHLADRVPTNLLASDSQGSKIAKSFQLDFSTRRGRPLRMRRRRHDRIALRRPRLLNFFF